MARKRKAPSSKTISITGDGNVVGDNNVSTFQKDIQTINSSVQEFLSLLDLTQKLVHESQANPVVSQRIESEVEALKELVRKPAPEQKPTILSRLKNVEELLKTSLGLGTLSLQLMPTIERLLHLAKTAFG